MPKPKSITKLKAGHKRKLNKLGIYNTELAEISFMLPRFIEDEKGNVYKFGHAQSVSWSQSNHDSFLPYYKLVKGKQRKIDGRLNHGYLTINHWKSDTEYNAKASLLIYLIKKGWWSAVRANRRLKTGFEEKDFMI